MVDVSRLNLFKSSPSPLASWIPSSISAPFTKDQIGQIEQYCKLCVIQPSIPLPVLPPDLVPWPSLVYSTHSFSITPTWIIYSRASDHVTGVSNFFCSYTPCTNHITVKIADGFLTRVARYDNIKALERIVLKNAFHVPSLRCNLIYVSKLTMTVSVLLISCLLSCQFQDLPSARMIGSAKLHDGLYFLEHSPSSSRQYLVSSVESSPISHFQEIVLQHFRLGHPSFSYLAHLFLYYFKIIKISVYFIVNSVNLLSIFVSPFHLIHTHLSIFTNS